MDLEPHIEVIHALFLECKAIHEVPSHRGSVAGLSNGEARIVLAELRLLLASSELLVSESTFSMWEQHRTCCDSWAWR